jgi:hypothetical protein
MVGWLGGLVGWLVGWVVGLSLLTPPQRHTHTHNPNASSSLLFLFNIMQALRVQHSKKKFLNAAYACVTSSSDPAVMHAHQQASAAISEAVFQHTAQDLTPPPALPPADDDAAAASAASASGGFVLITQFYFPEDLTSRQNIQDVLVRNLQNDAIEEIYLICDEEYNFDQLPNHHKITKFILKTRLKFSDALRVANDRLAGRSVVLSNSDIYFDSSLQDLIARRPLPLDSSLVLALSTWTPTGEGGGSLSLNLRSDSQDAWFLTAPVSEEILRQTDFFFGAPRCDNRIAKVFLDSGYR